MPRNSQSEFTVKIHTSYSWELLGKIPRQKKEEVAKPHIYLFITIISYE